MIQTRPSRLEVKLLKTGPVGILDIFATFLQMVLTKLWCRNSIVMNLIYRFLLDRNGTELSSTPKIHRYISFTAKIYFFVEMKSLKYLLSIGDVRENAECKPSEIWQSHVSSTRSIDTGTWKLHIPVHCMCKQERIILFY